MKYLTTYLDDEINFKFGNNGSIIELKAVDDHAVMSFSNEEKLLIRIKNEESYIKTVPVTAERKIIQLPTKLLKDLTVGQYDVELWQGEGDDQVIYPDEGFLRLKIHGNASQIDGSLVSSITLADFEKKFNDLAQKIEDKLEKLPDIDGKNISIDVKVVDGNLCINGKDTGINLTAKDGRDGRDGHTPEITVSDAGTLVVDGIDTNKSLIGPRGENGLPGKDGVAGQDGKSAYQVAVDNGFDGTEVEWLRSLHGNDGLDGKSGRDGLPGQSGKSAYEIAITNGFTGTETEWLNSLKGQDGKDGSQGPRGEQGVQGLPGKDGLNGKDGIQGPAGTNGKDGQSAYQLWLSQGNSGSEIDFLQSLRGSKGDTGSRGSDGVPGKSGLSAYEIWKNAGHQGTEQDFLNSLRGSQGERGSQGVPGPSGKDGLSAYEVAKRNGFTGTEKEWIDSLRNQNFNKTTINKIFDKYSNKFHINMPDNGFLNDVQGAFYRNGIWHMYFLYNADAKYNVNGDQIGGNGTEWYHVTTKDWVKWNYEGVAIHKYKTAWGDVASGTIYIDFDNRFGKGKDAVIVFATAYGGDKGQNVMGYYSTDNGYTFSPLQADPILRHVGGSDTNFRDPYLFRMGDTWVIYMAEGDKFGIYTSNNPLSGYNYIDGYFAPHALLECPSLFKLNVNGDQNNQKWVLFYGGNGGDDATTGTYASVGYLTDKYVFKAEQENIRVDYGPDYYGAKMFSNEFNNNDFVYSDAWLGNWGYATKVPNNGRIGAISTTRKITLRNENNKYTLNNEIVGVFPDYLDNPIVGTNLKTNTGLPMFKGDSFYLKFRIKDVRKLNENMTVKLVGNQYDSDMLFNFKDNNVKVHRYNSSFNNNDIYGRDRIFSTNLDKENDLWIELLVDRTCIEMRLSNGDIFTMTKFPAGRSRENICVSADNTVDFDYEYYQIMPQEV
ncbi:hypothetical protein [Limosilactobacillus caviae]|uniref:hypothetical protein n=1 Tax=Limosilactobacillus caviae TaxID=1769424 RepID=UPI001E365208|nr:hypothetical protein [Limosilactobacillus caviae]MCD7123263.1 hypothetical protein [Limosilactobacillus caviae]